MSTIQTLTTEQIEQYQRLVEQQGINAVPGVYAALNSMGFGYAGWAYGVSTGDSVTGMGALDFMQETALRLGTTISPEKVNQVRVGMLNGYLDALSKKAEVNGGFINEEIKFEIIRDFHIAVFIDQGLSIDYWTLETPMKIIMENFGVDVVNQKWQELTETNGTGVDALLNSLILVDWVTEASHGTIYLDENNNLITRSELLLHPELRLQITQTKDVSAYSDDAEEWLARLSLGGVGSLGHYIYKQFFGEDSYWVVGDQSQVDQNDVLSVPSGEDVSYVYGLGGKDTIYGASAQDHLYGGSADDELYGKDGNDYLYGGLDNDKLYGGVGKDRLDAASGNDILDGGEGDDILVDESGNDTYIFDDNFGHDTIYDQDGKGLIRIDGLILSAGERINDDEWKSADGVYTISVVSDSDGVANFYNLVITKNNDINNSITIKSWQNGDLGITLVNFGQKQTATEGQYAVANNDNNIIFDEQYLMSLDGNDLIQATIKNDVVFSGEGNDFISTLDGDDFISAGDDNDIILAGDGRDTIYGENGNDLILTSATFEGNRNYFVSYFNQQLSGNQLVDGFSGLNFYFNPDLDENNKVESYYITKNGTTTYNILPIIELSWLSPEGLQYFGNFVSGLNYGVGYSGGDIAYGGAGNDIIIGSSDADYLYGGDDDDSLYALNGSDFVYGGKGIDILYGGDGVDTIYGGEDNDEIVGGHDKDYLYGGDGDDTIQGDLSDLTGNNGVPPSTSIYSRFGDDEIYGGKGKDTIWGNLGNDTIDGGDDDDTISGDHHTIDGSLHGNDTIRGGNGNDTIWGDGGKDTIFGGDGEDTINGDDIDLAGQFHSDDEIYGDKGKDKIWGDGGNDIIYGGEDDDYISGDDISLDGQYHGKDKLHGDQGNDRIFGEGGADEIYGDEGDDSINGDSDQIDGIYHGNDTIWGDEGNDNIWGGGKDDEIYGGEGNDYIEGDSTALAGIYHGNDKLYGGNGNDNIWGNGGNDELYGGQGDDYLAGDQKENRAFDGNDKLYGGSGKDTLVGFDGNDVLDGGEGDDLIFGGNGDDSIYSYAGNDQLAGGAGNDAYHITVRDSEIKVLDSSGENHFYFEGDFNFSKIKLHWYTNAVSLITPTPSSNPDVVFPEFKLTFFDDSETQPVEDENGELIEGEILKDEYGNPITGGYDQYLHFDLGLNSLRTFSTLNDTANEYVIHLDTYLKERAGLSYHLWTGSWHGIQSPYLIFTNGYIDNNNLIYENSELGDLIDIQQIRINVSQHGQYQADEYHLLGGDDEAQGSSTDDIVYGGAGDDKIFGNLGNDKLHGDQGNDLLYGGDGDDQLYGGDGQDNLYGGFGNDIIDGGDGNDQFFGGDGVDQIFGSDGKDIIYGEVGNDILYGGAGDDILYGGDGDDILNGGDGNNILIGGTGVDEYILDGFLTSNTEIQDADDSVLKFLNVNSQDVRLEVISSDLYIHYGNNSSVKLVNYIEKPYVLNIEFEDITWSKYELNSQITITQTGDEFSNHLIGKKDFTNIIYAGGGADVLAGGGDFKNYLYGGDGDDVFYSGGVNSETYMYGGSGVDRYSIQFNNTSWIKDGDSGLINISSDVYFTLVGNVFTQSPNSSKSEFIEATGNHSYYKYSLNNTPLLKIEFNAENKTLAFFKEGNIIFGLQELQSIQDISGYSEFNIKIEGEDVYHTSGTYSHFSETTFNFVDFIKSFSSITLRYNNSDDVIQGYAELNNIIYAGDGNNIITTGIGNDTIYAGKDHDEIYAGEGNNIIDSGDGGDKIVVGNGYNKITSGSGNDEITIGGGGSQVFSGAGDDLINGENGSVYGEAGNDQIYLNSGEAYGSVGDDIIIAGDLGVYMDGGAGADHLVGGLGDDTFVVDEFDIYEENDPDGGYDTIHIAQSFDLALNNFEAVTLLGNQNLNAFGDEFENRLIGNSGNNYMDGRAGSDYMAGGLGDDYYVVDTVDFIITDENENQIVKQGDLVQEDSDSGVDTIERWIDSKFIGEDENGTPALTNLYKVLEKNVENLVLKGSATVGFGNDLNNTITGNEQNNYIDGLAGDDTYIYNFGGGKDTFVFKDSIHAFNNLIINDYDQSQIYARQSGNSLTINFKNNLNDQITINNYFLDDDLENDISYKQDEIQLSNGFILDTNWIENSLSNLEGTDGNDTIWGLSRSENIYGGLGSDYLVGQGGNDNIYGGSGNDVLVGGTGIDVLDGGAGDDKYYYYLVDGADVINQTGGGTDVLWLMDNGITRDRIGFSKDGDDLIVTIDQNSEQSIRVVDHFLGGEKTISSVQPNGGYAITAKEIDGIIKAQAYGGLYDTVLEGTNATETIYGTSGKDLIQGLDGNDTIWAQAGNDRLEGGIGNDYLDGGAGDDSIYGGIGNDTLIGGTGADILDGGAGDDKYYYYLTDGVETIDQTGGGTDVIWLMDQGITEDRIKFTKENNDLLITIDNNANQSIRVKDHFLGGEKAIASVQPNGGYTITAAQIATKVNGSGSGTETPNPAGDTTYNYSGGVLTITEASGTDKVVFASGITMSQISSNLTKSSNDLLIKVNGSTTNVVTVKNFFLAGNYLVETFQTATGEQLTANQIFTAFGLTMPGTGAVGDTTYNYSSGSLTITEVSGNDKVVFASGITYSQVGDNLTKSGNDLIIKVNGSTTNKVTVKDFFLAGDKLVETFKLATGEEITAGQIFTAFGLTLPSTGGSGTGSTEVAGDTTYSYTTGDLTINEISGNDKVIFKNGITFSQIGNYLTKSGNDLILKLDGSNTNKVTVKDFFVDANKIVETFEFETGGSITAGQIFGAFGLTMPSAAMATSSRMIAPMSLQADQLDTDSTMVNNAVEAKDSLSKSELIAEDLIGSIAVQGVDSVIGELLPQPLTQKHDNTQVEYSLWGSVKNQTDIGEFSQFIQHNKSGFIDLDDLIGEYIQPTYSNNFDQEKNVSHLTMNQKEDQNHALQYQDILLVNKSTHLKFVDLLSENELLY